MATGKKTGGGSRKGSPNKITKDIKAMILGALDAKGGQVWLEEQMNNNPTAFMTLLGRIVPTKTELSGSVDIGLFNRLKKASERMNGNR
jgi:hypothetical protein